jgi:hypothetical protein
MQKRSVSSKMLLDHDFQIGDLVADKYGFTGLIAVVDDEYNCYQIQWNNGQYDGRWYSKYDVEEFVNYLKQI